MTFLFELGRKLRSTAPDGERRYHGASGSPPHLARATLPARFVALR